MSVRPKVLGARVLVKPMEANERTSAGIVLPSEVRQHERRGVVLAVGEFRSLSERDFPVEVGDVVVWADCPGPMYEHPTEVVLDVGESGHQETLIVMPVDAVLLVLEDVRAAVAS